MWIVFVFLSEQSHASENYTSTLAHKLNHSFIANCEWSNAEHPCYGLVPSVTTCFEVLEGQELTVNYGLDMEVCLAFLSFLFPQNYGHAANIAPPTPPPPPAGFDSQNPLDSAPGIAMEYKVHVEAGKEDCYWQYVHKGATLYVSYQVLKGGDGSIGMAVRNPSMKVVHPYAWKATSEYEESDVPQGGYYSVCLDNQFSRFSAKLVNLYLTTFR